MFESKKNQVTDQLKDYYFDAVKTDSQPQESNYNIEQLLNEISPEVQDPSAEKSYLSISIIGLGYVGSVSCACFSSLGHQVIGVDPEINKVQSINHGHSPIVEPQLGELLLKSHNKKTLTATTNIEEAVLFSDITLVSVGTPSLDNGGCDLKYLKSATIEIGKTLAKKDSYHVIVFRSTVPPTTTNKILIPLLEKSANKLCGKDFGVCFNPEFLRESTAIDDFYHPPKMVMGSFDSKSAQVANKLYQDVEGSIILTSIEAAEFVKYIDNTWHALKVSFGNEVGRICKALEVDSHEVMNIFLQDTKLNISPYYLKPGFAFGGSCLPKDTRGIVHMANSLNVNIPIIEHINQSNSCHISHAIDLIEKYTVSNIGIVGLTFKSDTDDLRESPSIELIKKLICKGYNVQFYDPCIKSDMQFDSNPELNQKINNARCNTIERLIDCSQSLVITHKSSYANKALKIAPSSTHIIDVVHLTNQPNKVNYHGLCW